MVAVVVSIAVPTLAVAVLGEVTSISLIMAEAAIGSAVSQGICLALHVQDKFDFENVVISAASAGLTAKLGLNEAVKQGMLTPERLLRYGYVNASMQLLEMSIGTRQQFNPREVLAAIGNGFVREKLPSNISRPMQGGIQGVTQSLMNLVVLNKSITPSQLAANAVGMTIGTAIGEELALRISAMHEHEAEYQTTHQTEHSLQPKDTSLSLSQDTNSTHNNLQQRMEEDYHELNNERQSRAKRWQDEQINKLRKWKANYNIKAGTHEYIEWQHAQQSS